MIAYNQEFAIPEDFKVAAYQAGRLRALEKLGMQLEFNSPQQAAQHAQTRGTIGKATGFAGNMVGGTAAGIAGTALGGPVGSIAGGIAGGELAEKAVAMPATTMYDMAHDIPQKAKKTYNQTLGRLNMAAGTPAGR